MLTLSCWVCTCMLFLSIAEAPCLAASTSSAISSEIGSDASSFSRQAASHAKYQPAAVVKIQLPSEEPLSDEAAAQEFYIREIKLDGVNQISLDKLRPILAKFENRNLSLKKLRAIAREITQYYRRLGFITSRAYVPPQKIENQTVTIQVVEGRLDKVIISGNKYISSDWLMGYVTLKSGQIIQYSDLLQVLQRMNTSDREVTAALKPGNEAATSDILLNVQEQRPYHLSYTMDDYGTRLTGRIRQGFEFQYSNLLHRDDMLYNAFNISTTGDFLGESLNYVLPVSPTGGKFILSYSYSNVVLGKEYQSLDLKGGANIGGIDYVQPLVDTPMWSMNMDAGFNPEEIWTTEEGQSVGKNHLSLLHFGPNVTIHDNSGTTSLGDSFIFAVPEFMGSDNTHDFVDTFDVTRVQSFLWNSSLVARLQTQWTKDSLVSAQQFRLGGNDTVRGYDEGDTLGDEGVLESLEWRIPPYFLPQSWHVPFRPETYWQAVQFLAFIDAGTALNHDPEGDDKSRDLAGTGVGVRINLGKNMRASVDCGWPVGAKPQDGGRSARWHFGITISF